MYLKMNNGVETMKRILSLLIVFSLVVSMCPVTVLATGATNNSAYSTSAEKQLAEVKVYDESDALILEEAYHYENDLLVGISYTDYENAALLQGSPSFSYERVLTYDSYGRLISTTMDHPFESKGEEYTYNDAGLLISKYSWAMSEYHTEYEYDVNGRCIQEITTSDDGTATTDYVYNEKGLLSSATIQNVYWWDSYRETITYTYDRYGRISETSRVGSSISSFVEYSYDYAPFVVAEHTEYYNDSSYCYTFFSLEDDNGFGFSSAAMTDLEFSADSDGYLSKVAGKLNGEKRTYKFSYITDLNSGVNDSERNTWQDAYYDFIIQDSNSGQLDFGGYNLIYLDDDDIPELWIDYIADPIGGAKLVSYANGAIISTNLGMGGELSYIERGGLFYHTSTSHATTMDTIGSLVDGQFTAVAQGSISYPNVMVEGGPTEDSYYWNNVSVTKSEYQSNLEACFDFANAQTCGLEYSYTEILDYLKNGEFYSDLIQAEWIEQHIEYAASETYQTEITPGYQGRMKAIFDDILEDTGIKFYDFTEYLTEWKINPSQADLYELLLSELLIREQGSDFLEQASQLNFLCATIKVLSALIKGLESSDGVKEDVIKSLSEIESIMLTAKSGSTEFTSAFNQFLDIADSNFTVQSFKKALKDGAGAVGLDVALDGLGAIVDSGVDCVLYIISSMAYTEASEDFCRVLDAMAHKVRTEFSAGDFPALGKYDDEMNWNDFVIALNSIRKSIQDCKTDQAAAVGNYAVERLQNAGTDIAKSVVKSVCEFSATSIAKCIPVVGAVAVAYDFLKYGNLAVELLTNVDEASYCLDVLTKLYCISVVLDDVADDYVEELDNNSFWISTAFDETISLYKSTHILAAEYMKEYMTGIIQDKYLAFYLTFDVTDPYLYFITIPRLQETITWYENGIRIICDRMQAIQNIQCHSSDLQYDPVTGDIQKAYSNANMYIIACPTAVIVTDQAGQQVAYLSNDTCIVLEGHELYYQTVEISETEAMKIAIVPDEYTLTVTGTGEGEMNVFATDFSAEAGAISTYLDIPVQSHSVVKIEDNLTNPEGKKLTVDGVEYQPFIAENVSSGTCGEDLEWSFDPAKGLLSIYGSGAMEDYGYPENSAPWWGCREEIQNVEIAENVTYIGVHSFGNCSNLTNIVFSGNAPGIGDNAFYNVTASVRYPADGTWTTVADQNYGGNLQWKSYCSGSHSGGTATCTHRAVCTVCGEKYGNALDHDEVIHEAQTSNCTQVGWDAYVTCSRCDYSTYVEKPATGHNYIGRKCAVCGAIDPNWTEPEWDITRLGGSDRFNTAFLAANQMKQTLGIEKFDTVVVASGMDFADALSGSYLAAVNNAPILLACQVESINETVKAYIKENLKEGGKIYILGGTNAIPDSFGEGLTDYTLRRLAGTNRFDTNLKILKEAGIGDNPILVCTGLGFADSLSASATKLPILLVYGDKLTADQAAFLEANRSRPIYIIGGTSAVNTKIETQLKSYGEAKRVAGNDRFQTSVLIAETFFDSPNAAVLAYAWNFPDGLCGGPLAATMNAPLVLTMEKYEAQATNYIQSKNIRNGIVLGGETLIPDNSINLIFGLK